MPVSWELWLNLGDGARSGGAAFGIDRGDAVGEFDTFDDAGQLVPAVQLAPGLRSRADQSEHHEPGGLLRERALGPDGAMPDGREHALYRVRGSHMLPLLGGEVIESEQRLGVLGQTGDAARVFGA